MRLFWLLALAASTRVADAASRAPAAGGAEKVLKGDELRRPYKIGETLTVECLNRTVETGDHVRAIPSRNPRPFIPLHGPQDTNLRP